MKKFFLIVLLILLYNCERNDLTPNGTAPLTPSPPPTPSSIILSAMLDSQSESTALSWVTQGPSEYIYFQIMRKDSKNGSYNKISQTSPTVFSFTNNGIPFTPYLEYKIIGVKNNGEQVESNTIILDRSDIKLLGLKPIDAIFDATSGKIYIVDIEGKIAIYDVNQRKVTAQKNTNTNFGYADLGMFENSLELYIARGDGWVDVYDANNLNLKDQINFGMSLLSVQYHNGKVYGSSNNQNTKCYDRKTKLKISENTDSYVGRIKKFVSSGIIKLFSITQNLTPSDLNLDVFDVNGNFINHQNDTYHGDYNLNYRNFEVIPDGRIITGNTGTVYSNQMIFLGNLPSGMASLTSFDFDDANIIAGNMSRTIDFYNLNSYTKSKSISTARYPFRVFNYNNKVISLSSISKFNCQSYYDSNLSYTPDDVIVEVFDK